MSTGALAPRLIHRINPPRWAVISYRRQSRRDHAFMLLGQRKHKPSLFRSHEADQARADDYMADQALAGDRRMQRINRIEQALVQQYINALPAGAVVLDAPCGNGRMSQWVIDRGDLGLVAVDYNQTMLNSMRLHAQQRLLGCRVRADVLALPLADKSVDLAINMRLLHHIPDDATRLGMLGQFARVCRGTIITSYWTTHSWRYLRRRLLGKVVRGFPVSPSRFGALCAQCGLSIERIVPVRRWVEEQCVVICRTQ